ncbi:MAG: protein kinase [Rubrivivax sp.]|nr:protein kinase [Rubrivivax sp.]
MEERDFELDPGQWATLRRLLDEGLALEPAQRVTWLEGLAAPLADFKPRLRELLIEAPGTAHRLLDTLPKVETADFAPLRHGAAPERVGPYKLLRELGSGGMASVWLAERTDMLQGRQVALKLPHGEWGAYGSRGAARRVGLVERMAREREILATLNHPHIASLFDAGVAEDGQPYLALEYVEGERIDAYCTRHGLDVPARLRLFLQAARAVAHAHANLVVHRDLKPSNILVNAQGEVRLLDFGIAKLLDQGVAMETELTQQSGRALTPDYASPEQIRGEAIGTASDVYSLGVVLFELLTGKRPYKLEHASRTALEDAILRAEPRRPSAVVEQRRLQRALVGDLDTIVLKALKKVPGERYPTVVTLAEEIERHLDQRPVLAQPDSGFYRVRKLIARNRPAFAALGGVMLALLGGTGVALWQADTARAEQRRAQEVLSLVTAIFRDADPNVGPQGRPSATDLLARARQRLDSQLPAGSATRVEVLCVLAESFIALHDTDAAADAARAALAEATALHGATHAQALRARAVLAAVQRDRSDLVAARAEVDHILAALESDPRRDPPRRVAAHVTRADIANDGGDFAAAETDALQALRLMDESAGDWNALRALAWKALSFSLDGRVQYHGAIAAAEQAYRFAQAAHPTEARHPMVVNHRLLLARTLAWSDRFRESLPLMQQAIDDATVLYGARSAVVGQYLQNLSVVQLRAGALVAARANVERALPIVEQQYGPEGGHTVAALDASAAIFVSARQTGEAISIYSRLIPMQVKARGEHSEWAMAMRQRELLALAYEGQLDAARDRMVALAEAYSRLGKGSMARYWSNVGIIERLAGRPQEALQWQQRALSAVREAPPAERERMQIRVEIGAALVDLGRHEEALAVLGQALIAADRYLIEPTPMRSDALLALGRARLALGHPREALLPLQQADEYWRREAAGSRWAGESALWLARGQARAGQPSQARASFVRAASALNGSRFPGDARLAAQALAQRQ